MASVHDCVTLAEHVYAQTLGRATLGWSHIDGMCWMRGFAAATYTRGNECVVAFRGTETDDAEDIASDQNPAFVVGHSLGGALAQVVAQRRSITAIAFNSPNMGDLRGMVPMTSMRIAHINAAGDPLSIATRAVGNLPHGRVITVVTPPPLLERAGTLASSLRRVLSRASPVMHEVATLLYIGKLAGYYHSIGPLREAIAKQPRFNVPLDATLRNLA